MTNRDLPKKETPSSSSKRGETVLQKLLKVKLTPSLLITDPPDGSTETLSLEYLTSVGGIRVEITWSTVLEDDTLSVYLDETDETSQFTIDLPNGKATALLPYPPLDDLTGPHTLAVSGEFLSSLVPVRTTVLNATSAFTLLIKGPRPQL